MRRPIQFLIAALILLSSVSTAHAATSAVNATTVSPTLQISVTVQKAIALTLSQGAGAGACTVTTASDYSISFGNVDALGINTPTCGSKFDPTTPGVSPSASIGRGTSGSTAIRRARLMSAFGWPMCVPR